MSTSAILECPNHSTIRSFAELHDALLADASLTDSRRREMASALNSLAKVLGRPPATILAEPASLRPALAGVTAAMAGMSEGRWRNVQSLISAALAHVGIVVVQGRIREQPAPEWIEILERAAPHTSGTERVRHFNLWRFARYCTLKRISPDAVDDAVIAIYLEDLTHRSMVSEPERAARDAARFWNAAAEACADWPQQRLTIPDNRGHYALPLTSYPASLQQDIAAWTEWLRDDNPFAERDSNPLRPTSVATRRRELNLYLAALVDKGAKPEEMVSLAAVATPAQAKRALRFFWERAGNKPSLYAYHIYTMILGIARHWAKLPEAEVKELIGMAGKLRPPSTGITSRNISRLRQLDDPQRFDSLLTLPGTLIDEAKRAGAPTAFFARQVQTAVAIELLLNVPLRIKNLRELRIGVDLLRGPGKAMSLEIPGDQVKNQMPINARLPEYLVRLITLYIERYRPLLDDGADAWLFPGLVEGQPKSEDGLRSQIQKALADRCGLRFNPHLFRHLAAMIVLRQNPDAHGQVQRILNHKSLAATMAFYSGLEAPAAIEHYDGLLGGLRDSAVARSNAQARAQGKTQRGSIRA
jgi:integrase